MVSGTSPSWVARSNTLCDNRPQSDDDRRGGDVHHDHDQTEHPATGPDARSDQGSIQLVDRPISWL
jgi:hypothetical protein